MLINSRAFGEIVLRARGDRSQGEITALGGPPRQRQALVEHGDPVVLTPRVLEQLEAAYGWPAGTGAALLSRGSALSDPAGRVGDLSPGALGVDADGQEVLLPGALVTTSVRELLPLIRRWQGPVLIDAAADGDLVVNWPWWAAGIDPQKVYRAGTDLPVLGRSLVIDPISAVSTYQQAKDLIAAVARMRRPITRVEYTQRRQRDKAAFTLLFLAAISRGCAGDGLDALSAFGERWKRDLSFREQWDTFYQSSGFSSAFQAPDLGLTELLSGLLALRDLQVDLTLVDDGQGRLRLESTSDITAVGVGDLDGAVVFYDWEVCPQLPAGVDWAYAGRRDRRPLLIVAAANTPYSAEADSTGGTAVFGNSHLVVVGAWDEGALVSARAPYAKLVDLAGAGPATLLPGSAAGSVPVPVWLSPAGKSVTNIGQGGDVVAFYRAHRPEFDQFVEARLDLDAGEQPCLTLVDGGDNELHLWGLFDRSERGVQMVVEILVDAGLGEVAAIEEWAAREADRSPRRLFRRLPDLNLTVAGCRDGLNVVLDLSAQQDHCLVGGGDVAGRTAAMTEALLLLCAERSSAEVAVMGMTGQPPRDWVDVAELPHTVAFAGPSPAQRDRDRVTLLRWLDGELRREIERRETLLRRASAVDADDYRRRFGYAGMPALIVALDGIDDVAELSVLPDVFTLAHQLDLHVLLSTADASAVAPYFPEGKYHQIELGGSDAVESRTDDESQAYPLRQLLDENPITPTDPPVSRWTIPIGTTDSDLDVARLDLAEQPHLLVFGEPKSGKTATARAVATAIIARNTPEQVKFMVIDLQGGLECVVPHSYLLHSAERSFYIHRPNSDEITAAVNDLAALLRHRTSLGSRPRADVVVLVDNWQRLIAAEQTGMEELCVHIRNHRETRLHFIATCLADQASLAAYRNDSPVGLALSMGAHVLALSAEQDYLHSRNFSITKRPPGEALYVKDGVAVDTITIGYVPPATGGQA